MNKLYKYIRYLSYQPKGSVCKMTLVYIKLPKRASLSQTMKSRRFACIEKLKVSPYKYPAFQSPLTSSAAPTLSSPSKRKSTPFRAVPFGHRDSAPGLIIKFGYFESGSIIRTIRTSPDPASMPTTPTKPKYTLEKQRVTRSRPSRQKKR